MTTRPRWTWPTCCQPVEAHGSVRHGRRGRRPILVLLHDVSCTEPAERRKAVGPIPRTAPHRTTTRRSWAEPRRWADVRDCVLDHDER